MKTTKTLRELRKQYLRIYGMWNTAYQNAQDTQDSETENILDARGARIDKTYNRLARKMERCICEYQGMTYSPHIPFWSGKYDNVAVNKNDYAY